LLLVILAAMGLVFRIEQAGLHTLQKMTERCDNLYDDDAA
jgi:hypothetical protein